MVFEELLQIVGDEPVFSTGLLLSGDVNPDYLRRQLSGWVGNGRIWQLRRGLYALAPPYQKTPPHPFLVANGMVSGSYVSLQAALGYYGLIPEHVKAVTSVTTQRPDQWQNDIGTFSYRHIHSDLFFGYKNREVATGQFAFIAQPEKALLDLVHLQPGGDSKTYLASLRLQNLDLLDTRQLKIFAQQSRKSKLRRAAAVLAEMVAAEQGDYEPL